jgi:hypothetical protein
MVALQQGLDFLAEMAPLHAPFNRSRRGPQRHRNSGKLLLPSDQAPTWASASTPVRSWGLNNWPTAWRRRADVVARNVAEGWILVIDDGLAMAGVLKIL